jgi:hypothetical protein
MTMVSAIIIFLLVIVFNSSAYFFLGRWSVHRTPQYRMGDKIVHDIQEVLDRRQLIGDNIGGGMTITNVRGWHAFGYDWEVNVVQKERVNGDRTRSSAAGGTLPQR